MARIKNFLTPQWLKELEELKLQAASVKRVRSRKLQAPSLKQVINETVPWNEVLEATSSQAPSGKPQAPSSKRQASSRKRQAP